MIFLDLGLCDFKCLTFLTILCSSLQVLPEAAAGGPAEGEAGEAAGGQEDGGEAAAERPGLLGR